MELSKDASARLSRLLKAIWCRENWSVEEFKRRSEFLQSEPHLWRLLRSQQGWLMEPASLMIGFAATHTSMRANLLSSYVLCGRHAPVPDLAELVGATFWHPDPRTAVGFFRLLAKAECGATQCAAYARAIPDWLMPEECARRYHTSRSALVARTARRVRHGLWRLCQFRRGEMMRRCDQRLAALPLYMSVSDILHMVAKGPPFDRFSTDDVNHCIEELLHSFLARAGVLFQLIDDRDSAPPFPLAKNLSRFDELLVIGGKFSLRRDRGEAHYACYDGRNGDTMAESVVNQDDNLLRSLSDPSRVHRLLDVEATREFLRSCLTSDSWGFGSRYA